MHGAFVAHFHQPRALTYVEIAFERNHTLDMVDQALLGLALGAIDGVDPIVPEADFDARQRPFFPVC